MSSCDQDCVQICVKGPIAINLNLVADCKKPWNHKPPINACESCAPEQVSTFGCHRQSKYENQIVEVKPHVTLYQK